MSHRHVNLLTQPNNILVVYCFLVFSQFHGRNRKKYSSMALSNLGTQTNVTSVGGGGGVPNKQNGTKSEQKQLGMNHGGQLQQQHSDGLSHFLSQQKVAN